MEEAPLFRVIDVYLRSEGFPPLLQEIRLHKDPQEEDEEGLVSIIDDSTQQQMRALGLPTRFSSGSCKRASPRLRRSSRSDLVEQCSQKLCDGLDQVWVVQRHANYGATAPEKQAKDGEGALSRDDQASNSPCLLISDDHIEASVLGGEAVGCSISVLDARVQADVSTVGELGKLCDSLGGLAQINEFGNVRESKGWLGHERLRNLDGGGLINGKEANWPVPKNMRSGHSLELDCTKKVLTYETNHCTEDPVIGSSRIDREGNDCVELTLGVDDHGENIEGASLLSCGVKEGDLSCGMVAREAISETGTVSSSQPHAMEGERISDNRDFCKTRATKEVSNAEATLVPTDGAFALEEPLTILSSKITAQGEQLTSLSGSNQKMVRESSTESCDARANDVLAQSAEQESFIEEGLHTQTPEVLSWSACWDDHYGRYYFYNAETLESTWEPPQGFESYACASASVEIDSEASQDDPRNVISSSEELVVEESEKEKAPSQDGFKVEALRHVPLESEVEGLQILCVAKEALKCSENHVQNLQSNYVHGTADGGLPVKEVTTKGTEAVLESSICQVLARSASESSVVEEDTATAKVFVPTRRAKKAARCLVRLENHGLDLSAAMGDHSSTNFKYWTQRFHLFSKYDLGVKLDEEGWFSVTPETIAKHQAARCRHGVVVDAFAGMGGNAIQFALADHYVVAIDNDPKKIEYARHNAAIYGVADRIDFVLGDFFAVAPQLQADVVFLSPPWGGPDYLSVKVYDILTMLQPMDGVSLFKVARAIASNVIFFLPRNIDVHQLAELSKALSSPCTCEVERTYLNGKLKAITAYYGQFRSTENT